MRLAQFAATVNDTNPRHLAGDVAFPVFATIPPMQAAMEVLSKVTDLPRLHGEHDIRLYKPIRPGVRLFSRAVLHGVRPSRAGVTVAIRTETADAHGDLFDQQLLTTLIPGATLPHAYGADSPGHGLPEDVKSSAPKFAACFDMHEDQTRRYCEASRDYSEYTTRLEAARAKGFDGLLVHGLLTMAFACRAVVQHACSGDSTILRRLACRFTAPVILTPGQAISTSLWQWDVEEHRPVFGFESTDARGSVVIGHGRAELQS